MSTTHDLAALDAQLNQMILSGKALEAMEKFYDTNVVMQENLDAPMTGLAANIAREKEFFGQVERFAGAVTASASGDDVTISEWTMDVGLKNGFAYKSAQTAVRRGKEGKSVPERFYYKPAA